MLNSSELFGLKCSDIALLYLDAEKVRRCAFLGDKILSFVLSLKLFDGILSNSCGEMTEFVKKYSCNAMLSLFLSSGTDITTLIDFGNRNVHSRGTFFEALLCLKVEGKLSKGLAEISHCIEIIDKYVAWVDEEVNYPVSESLDCSAMIVKESFLNLCRWMSLQSFNSWRQCLSFHQSVKLLTRTTKCCIGIFIWMHMMTLVSVMCGVTTNLCTLTFMVTTLDILGLGNVASTVIAFWCVASTRTSAAGTICLAWRSALAKRSIGSCSIASMLVKCLIRAAWDGSTRQGL